MFQTFHTRCGIWYSRTPKDTCSVCIAFSKISFHLCSNCSQNIFKSWQYRDIFIVRSLFGASCENSNDHDISLHCEILPRSNFSAFNVFSTVLTNGVSYSYTNIVGEIDHKLYIWTFSQSVLLRSFSRFGFKSKSFSNGRSIFSFRNNMWVH